MANWGKGVFYCLAGEVKFVIVNTCACACKQINDGKCMRKVTSESELGIYTNKFICTFYNQGFHIQLKRQNNMVSYYFREVRCLTIGESFISMCTCITSFFFENAR